LTGPINRISSLNICITNIVMATIHRDTKYTLDQGRNNETYAIHFRPQPRSIRKDPVFKTCAGSARYFLAIVGILITLEK